MKRVRIEYFDQNESFRSFMPRRGAIVGMFRDLSGDKDWTLVRLDESFEWQLKVGEPYQFRLLHIDHFLIKSRWSDHSIGDTEPTSVFVLLVEKDSMPQGNAIDVSKYVRAVWGTCYSE